jgi:NADH dehydrogenase FAD-containing subunit
MAKKMETEFLIAGSGFGDLETALQLRRKAKPATITRLGKRVASDLQTLAGGSANTGQAI